MEEASKKSLQRVFTGLEDPRVDRTKLHQLEDIILIAILAVICGAEGWVDIEAFGKAKEEWSKTFLALPNGNPSHDTFGRVFARIDPQQFEQCFRELGAKPQREDQRGGGHRWQNREALP